MNIEAWLEPISSDNPAGNYDEYDQRWIELDSLLEGRGAGMFGDSGDEGTDWRGVRKLTSELLKTTRHVRLGVVLTQCALHEEGIVGLADGLKLLQSWNENFWNEIHPASEDEKPFRADLIEELNTVKFIRSVSGARITQSSAGSFSHRDYLDAIAEKATPEEKEKLPLIEASLLNTPDEVWVVVRDALNQSVITIDWLMNHFDHAEGARSLNLRALKQVLESILRWASPHFPVESTEEEDSDPMEEGRENQGGGGVKSKKRQEGFEGEVLSRGDVIRALDSVIQYYKEREPSSPVRQLIARAKRLVPMSFLEIVQDLSQDGSKYETLFGKESE